MSQDESPETSVVQLYDYLSSTTHKNIFTAECIQNNRTMNKTVEICSYSLRELSNESNGLTGNRAERKSLKLSEVSGYVTVDKIASIYFVPEFYNNSILYVITRTIGM